MIQISLIGIFITTFTLTSASTEQCQGKCPIGHPNNDVYLLPHEDCGKFCSCVYGTPVEMICPAGTHFSDKYHVCTDPTIANCTQLDVEIIPIIDNRVKNECNGQCPSWYHGDNKIAVLLEHKECHKFCKCGKYGVAIHKCKRNEHFSLHLGGCTNPTMANCQGIVSEDIDNPPDDCCSCNTTTITTTSTPSTVPTCSPPTSTPSTVPTCSPPTSTPTPTPTPTSTPTPTPISTTTTSTPSTVPICPPLPTCSDITTTSTKRTTTTTSTSIPIDISGCKGSCPLYDDNEVVHLAHKDCTKFCKCAFGTPYIMECPQALHFNPMLQVCDRPSHAGCVNTYSDSIDDPTPVLNNSPSSTIQEKPPTTDDNSRCIGICPVWEGDDVMHLSHEDCKKFCKCDFGIAYVIECPATLYWNPELETCDRISHSQCTDINKTLD